MPDSIIGGPSYVPADYSYFMRLRPQASRGFGSPYDTETLLFRWRHAKIHHRCGLIIYLAAPNERPLIFTENREGRTTDFAPSVRCVYHDGIWMMHPHEDPQTRPVFFWDVSDFHSLSIRGPQQCFGIAGSRQQGVDLDQLMSVARSLDL